MLISDLPSTSSNINNFPPQQISTSKQLENSNINLPLLFRHFDLQYSPIDNSVSLYSCGLYEIDIPRHCFGTKIAKGFSGRVSRYFPQQNSIFTRIWPYNEQKHLENKIVSKLIHLTPHKHSSLLHHVIYQKDLPYFPIIYFVAVRHSGFSKIPIKEKKIYKNFKECFDNKMKKNDLFSSGYSSLPRGICFDPLRLEKVKELPTIALYSLCSYRARKWRDFERRKRRRFFTMIFPRLRFSAISTSKSLPIIHSSSNRLSTEQQSLQQKSNEKLEDLTQNLSINKLSRDVEFQQCPIEDKIIFQNSLLNKREDKQNNKQRKFMAFVVLKSQTSLNKNKYEETKKDKKEDKKDKKKKNKEKKAERSKKIQNAGISSASTSSSSSSSSDAEAEEIHIVSGEGNNLQTSKQKVEPSPPPSQQQTTLETCHEEIIGPEKVTTEIDADGNIIKRVVRTEQIRHTVQSHSVQSVPVEENKNSTTNSIPVNLDNSQFHSISNGHHLNNEETTGELVSSKVVTTGNRTVETLTYKTEKDGITETRVEHRITIHSNEEIDHDSELSKAILEATSMNPELKVEKVEVSKK
uniref:4_1_CTD domain-containing protein n=1 Tax=Meloidogyne hapla TaxID=6305 RepID=A0A1I8C194_MELHA